MRPQNLHTKIFLDSGDPQDTREVLTSIGFLDGQTTNPSLIIKNPEAQERLARGAKFTQDEVTAFYKNVIAEIVEVLGDQSISIEVSADQCTTAESIIKQAHEMTTWAKHPHIKIPITREGLKAGEILSREGIHLNYTLNFSQQQAAAVHAATRGAKKEQIYISPFHGRLDDYGVRGADVIANIEKMYRINHSHVQVLVASVRDYDTFLFAIASKTDHAKSSCSGNNMHCPCRQSKKRFILTGSLHHSHIKRLTCNNRGNDIISNTTSPMPESKRLLQIGIRSL